MHVFTNVPTEAPKQINFVLFRGRRAEYGPSPLKISNNKKRLLVYVVSEATRTVSEVVNFKVFLGEHAPRPPSLSSYCVL